MARLLKPLCIAAASLVLLVSVAIGLVAWLKPVALTDWEIFLNAVTGRGTDTPTEQQIAARLQPVEGFAVNLFATGLPAVRMLQATPEGDVLATRPRAGEVVLLQRPDASGRSPGRRVLLSGLDRPHGIDLADGWLYIGEGTAVGRVRFNSRTGQLEGDYQHIITDLGGDGNHWTKTVRVGPDGFLYLSQGSTCNVCEEDDKRRATLMRFNTDGSEGHVYATGLRNSVGLDWSPRDNALYATDNGRDLLGDDFPPCELNRIEQGGFYGWPYINGFGDMDPTLGAGHEARLPTARSPVHGFRAHNAPLGIRFLRGEHWPADYRHSALVALHGSWNRTEPDGYRVVSLHWDDKGHIEERDFLAGFEQNRHYLGRPVDIVESPDGSLYISDDYAGVVYRVTLDSATPSQDATAAAPAGATPAADPLAGLPVDERARLSRIGDATFQQFACGQCHTPGQQAGGRTLKPLQQLASRYDRNTLAAFFLAPTPPMPAYPLSEEQRAGLAVYLLETAGQ